MYYSNDIKSLNVLSLYEGELLGSVDKLYFDKKMKKLLYLELISENDTRLLLPTKNIYHIGKNAITVKNNQAVSLKVEELEFSICPVGSKAYTIKGEYLGIITEMSMNEKFLTEKFSLDNNTTLDVKNLASCGKNTVIFYDKTEHVDISRFVPNKSPKFFKTKRTLQAEIMPIETDEPKVETQAVPVNNEQKAPSQNADFLLGRVCTKDIFNFNNEILIKAHTIINKKNLKEINRFGKLRELMLFSK